MPKTVEDEDDDVTNGEDIQNDDEDDEADDDDDENRNGDDLAMGNNTQMLSRILRANRVPYTSIIPSVHVP